VENVEDLVGMAHALTWEKRWDTVVADHVEPVMVLDMTKDGVRRAVKDAQTLSNIDTTGQTCQNIARAVGQTNTRRARILTVTEQFGTRNSGIESRITARTARGGTKKNARTDTVMDRSGFTQPGQTYPNIARSVRVGTKFPVKSVVIQQKHIVIGHILQDGVMNVNKKVSAKKAGQPKLRMDTKEPIHNII